VVPQGLVHKESGKGCKSHLVRILIAAQVLALLGLGFRAERLTVPKGDPQWWSTRFQGWSPGVAPKGGPQRWSPRMVPKGGGWGPQGWGGPLWWSPKVVPKDGGWSPSVVPKGGPQRWSPKVVPKGGPQGWSKGWSTIVVPNGGPQGWSPKGWSLRIPEKAVKHIGSEF
jgi:hypothetical protein